MYNWNDKHSERSEKVKKKQQTNKKMHHLVQGMRFPDRRKRSTIINLFRVRLWILWDDSAISKGVVPQSPVGYIFTSVLLN